MRLVIGRYQTALRVLIQTLLYDLHRVTLNYLRFKK